MPPNVAPIMNMTGATAVHQRRNNNHRQQNNGTQFSTTNESSTTLPLYSTHNNTNSNFHRAQQKHLSYTKKIVGVGGGLWSLLWNSNSSNRKGFPSSSSSTPSHNNINTNSRFNKMLVIGTAANLCIIITVLLIAGTSVFFQFMTAMSTTVQVGNVAEQRQHTASTGTRGDVVHGAGQYNPIPTQHDAVPSSARRTNKGDNTVETDGRETAKHHTVAIDNNDEEKTSHKDENEEQQPPGQQYHRQQEKTNEHKKSSYDNSKNKPNDEVKEQQGVAGERKHTIPLDESTNKETLALSTTAADDKQGHDVFAATTAAASATISVGAIIVDDENATSQQQQGVVVDTIMYDVIIAGAGPSGLTAALFASRAGLNVYVLGSSATGLLSQTKHLDNFPSFVIDPNTGPSWLEATKAQAESFGAQFGPPGLLLTSMERHEKKRKHTDTTKTMMTANDDKNTVDHDERQRDVYFALKTDKLTKNAVQNNSVHGRSVIVASGATPRTLQLPGEDKLWGVSLHNCAICDGYLYQEPKPLSSLKSASLVQQKQQHPTTVVLVVGGGDAALDAALLLSRYATKVILIHRRNEFTKVHNPKNLKLIQASQNIEILTPYSVKEWITDDTDPSQLTAARLSYNEESSDNNSSVEIEKEEKDRVISIDGAFVMIGAVPNTLWTKNVGVDLNDEGLIKTTVAGGIGTDSTSTVMETSTNIAGLFAVGETTDNIYKQAITAASDGAKAAIDAERWLRENFGNRNFDKGGGKLPIFEISEDTTKRANDKTINSNGKMDADAADTAGAIDRDEENGNSDDCDLTLQDCINTIVQKYPVVVFSKPSCPYCKKALESLSLAGVEEHLLHVIDLSQHKNAQNIQQTLQSMTGRRTVPNVFIGGTSIGGGDETSKYQRNGQLAPMLEEAGALEKSGNSNKEDSSLDTSDKAGEMIKDGFKLAESKVVLAQQKRTIDRIGKTEPNINDDNGGSHSEDGEEKNEPLEESCDLESYDCFLDIVKKYPVLMFSLSWCPECKHSLELLHRIGLDADTDLHIIDLDDYKGISPKIRQHMKQLTGRRSVPNLFIEGGFIGGYKSTYELHERDELVPKLHKVGALAYDATENEM